MRPLLFKNLFIAFLTGLLVIAGVVYAMYITGTPEGGQLFHFSTPNTLPVFSGKSGSHLSTSTSSADFSNSDLDVVVSSSSKISSKITAKVAKTSSTNSSFNISSDRQSNYGGRIYTSTGASSVESNRASSSVTYTGTTFSNGSSRKIANYSHSNISVSKNGTGSSIHRTTSLPDLKIWPWQSFPPHFRPATSRVAQFSNSFSLVQVEIQMKKMLCQFPAESLF